MTAVEVYVDLLCPWAYQTSRWIREVAPQRDLELTWRFFSLEENKWQDGQPHAWERPWSYGFSLLRIGALLRRDGGDAALDRFLEVAGRLGHVDGRPIYTPEGARDVLRALGLDPQLVDAATNDDTTAREVQAEHEAAVARGVFGVPTLAVDGQLLYGPVIAPAPTGADALKLWDLVIGWTDFPHLYELQRPKTKTDDAHIGRTFAAYRTARGWAAP